MRILEGKELEDALKQMQEWEAKKAKAIEDAFQRGIATGEDITNLLCKHSASCVFFSPLFLPTFVASL